MAALVAQPMKNPALDARALRERALRLLARREHSRLELQRKLTPLAQTPADVESLLADFSLRGWINEERVAASLLHRKASRFGILRIRHALQQLGLPEELIDDSCAELKATQGVRARDALIQKFGQPATQRQEQLRQMRFLQARGFSSDAIRQAFKPLPSPDDQLANP